MRNIIGKKYPVGYKLRLADIEKVVIWKYLRRESIKHLKDFEGKVIDLNTKLLAKGYNCDKRYNSLKSMIFLSIQYREINSVTAEDLSDSVIEMLGFADRAEQVLKLCAAFKWQHGQNIDNMVRRVVYGKD